MTSSLEERIYRVEATGDVDAAIDAVYTEFLDLLDAGDTGRVGQSLMGLDVARLRVETMLAVLAITVPAAREIQGRDDFVKRVRERLVSLRGKADAERLLEGLT